MGLLWNFYRKQAKKKKEFEIKKKSNKRCITQYGVKVWCVGTGSKTRSSVNMDRYSVFLYDFNGPPFVDMLYYYNLVSFALFLLLFFVCVYTNGEWWTKGGVVNVHENI